jgi:hypothetical protein
VWTAFCFFLIVEKQKVNCVQQKELKVEKSEQMGGDIE